MPTKPKLFLLDAVVVIHLHELGLWARVTELADVIVPGVVADREVRYWAKEQADGDPVRSPINLRADAAAGRITIEEADAADLLETQARLPAVARDGVDPGELEALTLIRLAKDPKPAFCTADRLAFHGLCHLGFGELALSVEALLRQLGMAPKGGVSRQYSQDLFSRWIKEARIAAVQERTTVAEKTKHGKT